MKHKLWLAAALCGEAIGGGCARLAVEGGDKPIHIVVDVNVKIARELDNFFAFEDKPQPATTRSAAVPPIPPLAAQNLSPPAKNLSHVN